MIIISDATPIITLAKIDRLDILGRFYHEVLLPTAVFDEVCGNPAFAAEAATIQKCEFIRLKTVSRTQAVKILMASGLDLGESEAIVLADMLSARSY